jgi:hypothetical protein
MLRQPAISRQKNSPPKFFSAQTTAVVFGKTTYVPIFDKCSGPKMTGTEIGTGTF